MEKESANLGHTKETRVSLSKADSSVSKLLSHRQALETTNTDTIKRVSEIIAEKPTAESTGRIAKKEEIIPFSAIEEKTYDHEFYSAKQPENSEAIIEEILTFEKSIDEELSQLTRQNKVLNGQIADIEANRTVKKSELAHDTKTNILRKIFIEVRDYKKRKEKREDIAKLESRLAAKYGAKSSLERDDEKRRKILKRLEKRKEELFVPIVEKAAADIRKECLKFGEEMGKNPALIEQLDESLLKQKIIPPLEKLKKDGKISQEQADEYVSILRARFKEGPENYREPENVRDRKRERERRWSDLNSQMPYDPQLDQAIGNLNLDTRNLENCYPADYSKIFRLLSSNEAYQKLQKLSSTIGSLPVSGQ